jgi:phage repressor protein C with HTH and peptisase S24 domain
VPENTNLLVLNQQGNLDSGGTRFFVMNELKDRVLKRRKLLDLTQQQLAKKVGVKQQSIQQLEDGLVKRPRYLLELSRALECDVDWLATGKGTADFSLSQSRYVPGPANPTAAAAGGVITGKFPSRKTAKGDIEIPQYDVRASMGHGQVLPSDYIDTIRHITVGAGFLLEQGVSYTKPENLAVITGFGESMSKTFSSGDPLIIDQGVTTVVTDGVYLFTLGAELFVKRLQRVPGGVRVISDSDAYPPFEVTGRDIDSLVIHARVLLAWRSQRL